MSRGLVLTLLLLISVSGIRLLALQFKFRALSQVHPSRPPQSLSLPPLWHIFHPSLFFPGLCLHSARLFSRHSGLLCARCCVKERVECRAAPGASRLPERRDA